MGIGTWIILGGIAIVAIVLINPTNRRLLEGLASGNKEGMYNAAKDVFRSDPNAAARLKEKNPNLYNRLSQDKSLYTRAGYRY